MGSALENNGNPGARRIFDSVPTRTQNYGFDAANRVSSMAEAGGVSLSFSYDDYNNRWVTVPGGSPVHPAGTVSAQGAYSAATNRFAPATMGEDYEASGQTKVMEGGSIVSEWDSAGNRIKSTHHSYTPTTYAFDGLGQRVKKANDYWGTYVYVYDAFGRLAAEYGAGANGDCTTCYPITDPIGSTRLVANAIGDAVQRFDYTPFGPTLSSSDGTWANGRTGAVWDSSTTVMNQYAGTYRDVLPLEGDGDFAQARVFKRSLGRFWSPDENLADQHAEDPLGWNLYTYARNNPLVYTDPSGSTCQRAPDGADFDDLDGKGCGLVDDADKKLKAAVKVSEFASPSPLLLAVARGAQAANPVTDPRFIAGFYGASAVGGIASAAYGAVGGYTGVTTFGLKYSALGAASGAAFTAALNANRFVVPLKHLADSARRWAKFAQGVNPQHVIREALSSPNARFLPNPGRPGSFVVITNLGRAIGSKGETAVKVVTDLKGNIWTAYPSK